VHAETDAFRKGGRRRDYPDTVMVTTLSPCWYCSGLVRQFNIGAVVIGEATTFHGGHDWLAELGVEIVVLDDPACTELLSTSSSNTRPLERGHRALISARADRRVGRRRHRDRA